MEEDGEDFAVNDVDHTKFIENFVTECRVSTARDEELRQEMQQPVPSTSGFNRRMAQAQPVPQLPQMQMDHCQQVMEANLRQMTAEQRSEQIIRWSEASKARMVDLPGNTINASPPFDINDNRLANVDHGNDRNRNYVSVYEHPTFIDNEYCIVAVHIDESLCRHIEDGDYVDFNKLLPRDVSGEDDNRLELIYKQGKTYWVPVSSISQGNDITNFAHWEQAFRVYSNIYTRRHPDRASELIQYNHLINTAALTLTWENVYLYNRDFRRHMA